MSTQMDTNQEDRQENSTSFSLSSPNLSSINTQNFDERRPTNNSPLNTQNSRPTSKENSSPSFRKLPNLALAFERISSDQNRNYLSQCYGCKKKIRNNRLTLLVKHGSSCSRLADDVKQKIEMYQTVLEKELDEANELLCKMIVSANLPYRLLDNTFAKQLVSKAYPGSKIVSRITLSEKYVPVLGQKGHDKFKRDLKRDTNPYKLSVEFDHYEDYSHRSLLGFIATERSGERFLLDLIDVTIEGKSSAVTCPLIEQTLERYPSKSINSIISDSAAGCKLARSMLCGNQKYSHVIEHRCLAHWINLIGERFTEQLWVKEIIIDSSELTSAINNNLALSAKLKQLGACRLRKPTAVRWYANLDMIEKIIKLRPFAIELLNRESERQNIHLLKFIDDKRFENLRNVAKLLRPLVDCIAQAETASGSLGETMKFFMEFMKAVFTCNQEVEFSVEAKIAIVTYFNEAKLGKFEMGLMLASYFLDRRNKMDYITTYGKIFIFDAIAKVAEKTGFSASVIENSLVEQFKKYINQEGSLGDSCDDKTSAYEWWNIRPEDSALRTIALRIATLRSSSANMERIFSLIKLIQCPSKTRFNLNTLIDLIRAKLYFADDCADREQLATLNSGRVSRGRTSIWQTLNLEVSSQDSPERANQQSTQLKPGEQYHYQCITKLINFEIINEMTRNDPETPSEPSQNGVDRAVKKLRADLCLE